MPSVRPLAEGLAESGAVAAAPEAIGTGSTPTGSPRSPAELPRAGLQSGADGGCRREPERRPQPSSSPEPPRDRVGAGRSPGSSYVSWARILERIFEIDVLVLYGCGGRRRRLATIEDRAVIQRILDHLGFPATCRSRGRRNGGRAASPIPSSELEPWARRPGQSRAGGLARRRERCWAGTPHRRRENGVAPLGFANARAAAWAGVASRYQNFACPHRGNGIRAWRETSRAKFIREPQAGATVDTSP